jgi:hypothetical protein
MMGEPKYVGIAEAV